MFLFGGIRVGRLAGIPFFVNPSWFLIFAFVSYTLATQQLPLMLPGRQQWVYWLLGTVIALLFFSSLVAHEMGHSLISRAYGIPVRSITLHLFGGVAQLGKEVGRATEELWIALAGPAVSLVLSGLFWGGRTLVHDSAPTIGASLELVAMLNVGVVVFNMVPGFPLDGGRVLRALIWGVSGDYRKATNVAATAGKLIGSLLILLGVYLALSRNDLGSLWLALIGWFLINIARQSYIQAVIQDTLQRTPVSEAIIRLVPVPGYLTVDELLAGYIRTTGMQFYLVEIDDLPVGIITPHVLMQVPWRMHRVTTLQSVMWPLESLPEISPGASAISALNRMDESHAGLLRTVEHDYTTGVVTRDRLLTLVARAGRTG